MKIKSIISALLLFVFAALVPQKAWCILISEQRFSIGYTPSGSNDIATVDLVLTIDEDVEEHKFTFTLAKANDINKKENFTVNPLLESDFKTALNKALKKVTEIDDDNLQEKITAPDNTSLLFIRATVAINTGIDKSGPIAGALLIRGTVTLTSHSDYEWEEYSSAVPQSDAKRKVNREVTFEERTGIIKGKQRKVTPSAAWTIMPRYKRKIKRENPDVRDVRVTQMATSLAEVGNELKLEVQKRKTEENQTVKSVTIQFEDGFIQHIVVTVRKGENDIRFKNNFPIPIAGFRDDDKLENYRLYNKLTGKPGAYSIRLDEVLNYDALPQNGRVDYSPANQAPTFTPRTEAYILQKSPTRELFSAKVFSDFIGIGEDNANGLIQTQLDRRFNLWTRRLPSKCDPVTSNWGFFQWVEPYALISKMEKKNRELNTHRLQYINNGAIKARQYVTPVELMNYEHFSAGAKFNFILLNISPLKSTFYVNGITTLGLTTLADSIRKMEDNKIVVSNEKPNTYEASHMRFAPEIVWRIGGDGRVAFDISYSLNWNFMFNDKALLVHNIEDYKKNRSIDPSLPVGRLIAQISVKPYSLIAADSKKKLPDRGELFARFAYNHSTTNPKDNFMQVQLGYSFFLLANVVNK